jgi:hypothetical protein
MSVTETAFADTFISIEARNVRCWHEADIKLRPLFGRFGVESRLHWLVMSIFRF